MNLSRTLRKNGYRPWNLVLALLLGGLAILAAWPAWSDLTRIATRDDEASQILLAPFLAIWLVWQRRCRICRVVRTHEWMGPALMLLGFSAYVLGDAFMIDSSWYLGAILLLVGAVVTAFGGSVIARFAPAFAVLIFLIPIPGSARLHMAGPLQAATANAVEFAFQFTGMNVTRSGNLLIVNGKPVTVAEACNGMRMTFALILVTYTYVFSSPMRAWVRISLLVLSPIIAIGCNVVRLVPTLWAYGHLEEQWADLIHDWGGWVMLGISLMLLMGVARLMRWLELPLYAYPKAART